MWWIYEEKIELLEILKGHSDMIYGLAIDHQNKALASTSFDKTIRIWCIITLKPICVLTSNFQKELYFTSLEFCYPFSKGDDRYLVAVLSDGSVFCWKYNNENYEFNLNPTIFTEDLARHVNCSSFSKCGSYLAVNSSDRYLRVYHIDCKGELSKVREILLKYCRMTLLILFNNSGLQFAIISQYSKVYIYSSEPSGSNDTSYIQELDHQQVRRIY